MTVSDWRELVDFAGTPAGQAVWLSAVTWIMILVAIYALSKWRERFDWKDSTNEQLTNFRKMRERGVLREFEYRTVKSVLARKVQNEINRDGENS